MSSIETASHPKRILRKFEAGSSGWSVRDFDDPRYGRDWGRQHVELINGVIVQMPPAQYGGPHSSARLLRLLMENAEFRSGLWVAELDLLFDEDTVFRPDFTWLSQADEQMQRVTAEKRGVALVESRLLIPPTLLVESISPGYERHDRIFKSRRYAELGVRNYWIIDGFAKRLDCFVLNNERFDLDVAGKETDVLQPKLFSPLTIPLADLWL